MSFLKRRMFKKPTHAAEPAWEGTFHVDIIEEDGWFIAEAPELPGCISQGRSVEEARANIYEAVIGCLQVRTEMGLPMRLTRFETEVTIPRERVFA